MLDKFQTPLKVNLLNIVALNATDVVYIQSTYVDSSSPDFTVVYYRTYYSDLTKYNQMKEGQSYILYKTLLAVQAYNTTSGSSKWMFQSSTVYLVETNRDNTINQLFQQNPLAVANSATSTVCSLNLATTNRHLLPEALIMTQCRPNAFIT